MFKHILRARVRLNLTLAALTVALTGCANVPSGPGNALRATDGFSNQDIVAVLLAWTEGTTSPESLRPENRNRIRLTASDVIADGVGQSRGWKLVRAEFPYNIVGYRNAEWFSSPRYRGQFNDFHRDPLLPDRAACGIGSDLRIIQTQRIQT